jgi:hypothetical protein
MMIENIKTKERYTVAWWGASLRLGLEWYAFKRIEINGKQTNIWEGYVMNNRTSYDEFGDIDMDDIKPYMTTFAMGTNLNDIMPPIGFRRV